MKTFTCQLPDSQKCIAQLLGSKLSLVSVLSICEVCVLYGLHWNSLRGGGVLSAVRLNHAASFAPPAEPQ